MTTAIQGEATSVASPLLLREVSEWESMHTQMARGILSRPMVAESIRKMGRFHLQRFRTDLDPHDENHIGEIITRADGTLEYLKTYRLSAKQTRRAFLLTQLAAADWILDECAKQITTTRKELIRRMDNAGFGYLLNKDVLLAARRA